MHCKGQQERKGALPMPTREAAGVGAYTVAEHAIEVRETEKTMSKRDEHVKPRANPGRKMETALDGATSHARRLAANVRDQAIDGLLCSGFGSRQSFWVIFGTYGLRVIKPNTTSCDGVGA